MKLIKMLFAVLLIANSINSYAIVTIGDRSCGKWIAERSSDNKFDKVSEIASISWLNGFLTGLAVASNTDALKGTDGESVMIWMDNYCKNHPLDLIGTGATSLFFKLKSRMHEH